MAFLEKINKLAKNIEEKTGDVIEITKLNGQITTSKLAFDKEILKIGEFYYDLFLKGEELHVDIIETARNAKAYTEAIENAKAEIEKVKTTKHVKEEVVEEVVDIEGDMVPQNEVPEVVVEEPVVCKEMVEETPVTNKCPSCYKSVEANVKFCPNCGQKMEV